MGRSADPWRAAETWFRYLASHSVPLHAEARLSTHPNLAQLPAEPGICDRYDRSQRRRSATDELRALVRGWIARVVRCVTKICAGIPCKLIEPPSTLHRLRPYRSSNRTDRRTVHRRCVAVPPWPTALGDTNWTMAGRRLAPYRSKASPGRKMPAFLNFVRPSLSRMRKTSRNFYKAIAPRVCPEQSAQKPPQCSPLPTWRRLCESAIADEVMRNHTRRYIMALHGLRGVGKTTLAAAYAERHCGGYGGTWWTRAQAESTYAPILSPLAFDWFASAGTTRRSRRSRRLWTGCGKRWPREEKEGKAARRIEGNIATP
jgi:hypothetical protein